MVKTPAKLARQMAQRGWTHEQVAEAVSVGERHAAVNFATGGPATRYIHPTTGRSVIIDDTTGEIVHVGDDTFEYRRTGDGPREADR